jgi:hypothetical protein
VGFFTAAAFLGAAAFLTTFGAAALAMV